MRCQGSHNVSREQRLSNAVAAPLIKEYRGASPGKNLIMQTQVMTHPIDYVQAIAELVAKMPVERAAQVYDFACFLQARPVHTQLVDQDGDDWLNDTEEQMQAEDALWDAACNRHRDQFTTLVEAAYAEIEANTTQPMFNEDGELAFDELTHHA